MYNVVKGVDMPNLNDYVTVKGAAEILGVCPMTLRRWDEDNKLKPYRHPMNGYRLYKKSELQNILKTLSRSKK